ncbi:MAG TPA: hypothetical protein VD772_02485 [Anseongella sp.]|nr:hypothetical protein [Anseongella sp.]
MRNPYHILFEVFLIFLLAILFVQYMQLRKERDALQNSKKRLDLELKLRAGSATDTRGPQQHLSRLSDSLFDETDIRYFNGKGLKNPEQAILNDLYQQEDLVPEEAVLGGRMKIWHAVLLSRNWALAYFEDGHVAGNMLLRYTVDEGKISWELIDSATNGQ